LLGEDIPTGLLVEGARLQPPPTSISANDVLPSTLSNAWGGEETSAHTIAEALSTNLGKPVPWATVRAAIDGACQGRLLERTEDSGPWPCDYAGSQQVKLRVPPIIKLLDGVLTATADLKPNEVQELADQIGDISNAAVGYELKVQVRIEVVAKINSKLGEVSKYLKLG
jgi:hypothetical protein